ncbi:MAG: glycosyltransferase family 1 protein [Burkholderiaceae bacterium]|nr:glycosyltransferase family 1 protein [Microbacteriaceae bacterium]
MRIAIVTESFLPTLNGVTTSVCHVLENLAAAGHEAIVVTPAAGAPASYAGFPIVEVPAVAYRRFPVGLPSPALRGLLADFAPDVVHAASPFLLGAGAIAAARNLDIPCVAIYQTDVAGYAHRHGLGPATRAAWRLVRWVHEGADLTLVPSTSAMADLRRAKVPRLARWGRGVDLEAYHPRNRLESATHRARIAPGGETIIGYVGRLAVEKQVERLDALRGIRDIRLVIVGDGPSEASVRRALRGMPVTFLGPLSGRDLALAYASLDLFVHTGAQETFGQTIQEAHASGLPVIAPRSGGPIDLVDNGVDGFLVRDDDELRAAAWQLVRDPRARARFGEAGRRAVLGRSWASVCAELVAHYESVIASSTRPATARKAISRRAGSRIPT